MNKWTGRSKNNTLRLLAALVVIGLWWFFVSSNGTLTTISQVDVKTPQEAPIDSTANVDKADKMAKIASQAIMPLMPDLEAKKELGNASWKYFHTLLARFPDNPTPEQRTKLKTFVQLYAELYPCGECSYHFVKLLEKYPVQTSSRTAAALWGCHVHNIVNEFLKKPAYDCATILEDYDCGCGDFANEPKQDLEASKVTLEREARQGG